MGSLFSNKQSTSTSGTQSGTTQNNLWDDPNLQQFLAGYNQQFSGPNISQVSAPPNQYQFGAADSQSGVAGQLAPAFGTAAGIATGGIGPGGIAQWMNPFENQVVQNLQNDFASENARELSNIRGRAAQQGALGNSTTAVAERLATDSGRDRLDSQIAATRMAGYNQAAGLNTQDAQMRLAGAGQLGALTGAASGANTALGGLGQNIWQTSLTNTMLPYQLYGQGIQGYTGLGGLAGQNYTGQTQGTSQTTTTPSLGSIIAGLAGTVMTGFPMGGTGMKARGGAVTKRESGGPVMTPYRGGGSSFADKVREAHRTVDEMRRGGRVQRDTGGAVDPWQATVTRAGDGIGPGFRAPSGRSLTDMGNRLSAMEGDPGAAMLSRDQGALSQRLTGMMTPRAGFAEGGAPSAPWWMPHQLLRMALPNSWTGQAPPPSHEIDAGQFRPWTDPAAARPAPAPRDEGPFRPFGESPYRDQLGMEHPSPPMGQFGRVDSVPQQEGRMDTAWPATTTREPSLDGVGPGSVAPEPTTDLTSLVSGGMNAKPAYARDPGEAVIGPDSGTISRERSWMPFSTGIWAGERATPMQRFGMALTQVGNGPFAGFGQSMQQQVRSANEDRTAQLAADRLAHEMAHQRAVLQETTLHHRNTEDLRRREPRAQTEFDKTIAQMSGKDLEARAGVVRTAQDRLGRLDQLGRLLSDPNVPQGRFAGWELEGRRAAAALFPGFDPSGIAEAQAAQAITNQLALSLRSTAGGEGMPGAMSDQDREFLLRSIPRLENTREGNRVMIDMMRRAEEYKIAANQAAMQHIRRVGHNMDLPQHMTEWMRANPLVTPQIASQVERIAPPAPVPSGGESPTEGARRTVTQEGRQVPVIYRNGQWVYE